MDTTHLLNIKTLFAFIPASDSPCFWRNGELHNQRPVIAKWQPASLSLQGTLRSYPPLEPNHRTTLVAAVTRLQQVQLHNVAKGLQQNPDVVLCYVRRHLAKEQLGSRANTLLVLDHG